MENMDKKENGDMCGGSCGGGSCCGMSGHGCHGGKHRLVKVILKLIIIMLVFFFGFKLGEVTGYIKAEYGGYDGRGFMMGGFNNGWGMMRGYNLNNYSGQTIPTPTAPTPAK